MNPLHQPSLDPKAVLRILVTHTRLWLIPTVVVGLLAVAYAVVRPDTWEASQALIVRNEAANNGDQPGKFSQPDEMKTVQETILELLKTGDVLHAALAEVGPPASADIAAAWPSPQHVADMRGAVELTPPKGAEFGTTEVFYLKAADEDRARAVRLNHAVCDRLLARFQQLRDAKAQSMIEELVNAVELAKADLAESTARLTKIEQEVGSDLAELRALSESTPGESALRRMMTEIRGELRQIHTAREANEQLLVLLAEAQHDPGRLLAAPKELLDLQPALQRLKDGLVDAQLRTAALKGKMTDDHPLVQSAKRSEEEIGLHLHGELAIAIRGLESELELNTDRKQIVESQLADVKGRLVRLAELRATYANQVAEADNCGVLVAQAEQNLAETRATHASAKVASLISRIGSADAGISPLGPSRSMLVLVGIVGGLLAGIGAVVLTAQPAQPAVAREAASPQPVAAGEQTRPVAGTSPVAAANGAAAEPRERVCLKRALQRIGYGNPA